MVISHCDLWHHPYSLEWSSHYGVGLAVAVCTGGFQHDDLWCNLGRLWPCCSGCSGPVLAPNTNHIFAIMRSLQCNQCQDSMRQIKSNGSLCYCMYDYDFVVINIFEFEFEFMFNENQYFKCFISVFKKMKIITKIKKGKFSRNSVAGFSSIFVSYYDWDGNSSLKFTFSEIVMSPFFNFIFIKTVFLNVVIHSLLLL